MSIFSRKQHHNIFVSTLNLLHVKHTKTYTNKFYNEHPFKDDFLGLTKMFSEYGIEVKKHKMEHVHEIHSVHVPFISRIDNELILVDKVTDTEIEYIIGNKRVGISPEEFIKKSNGNIVIPYANKASIEPDYLQNRQNELFHISLKSLLLIAVITFCTYFYISQGRLNNWGVTLLLFVNLAGIYASYLLVLVQLRIQNRHAEKICSIIKQNSCSSILESKSARFLNQISWSNIGLSYFISNLLLILFLPDSISLLAIINVLGLPYTIWSIWYQKVKAKNWCSLCLIVQTLMWFIFIINAASGFISIGQLRGINLIPVVCIYLIPLLVVYFLIPKFGEARKIEQIIQEINKLKATNEIFLSFLKQQPYYSVDKNTSGILWGNTDADKLITIITNPHCDHCGEIHASVTRLLKNTENQFCVQYIFTAFGELFNSSNKFLIAAYYNHNNDAASEIYDTWFEKGKYRWDVFFEKFNFDLENCDVESEFNKHQTWLNTYKLKASPIILVNGYELPKSYKFDDLVYFSDCDLNMKGKSSPVN